jgi:hypothetical protein
MEWGLSGGVQDFAEVDPEFAQARGGGVLQCEMLLNRARIPTDEKLDLGDTVAGP